MRNDRVTLRIDVEELYADYAASLDGGALQHWPELFTETCVYRIVPRENFERNLPLALMLCESRKMLQDRVAAIERSSVYVPRTLRHLWSGLRVCPGEGGVIYAAANFVVLQTLLDEETRVFVAGSYVDRLVREAGALRFAEKVCVLDTNVVPGSLIYPV